MEPSTEHREGRAPHARPSEVARATALELAEMIRSGAVSAEDVTCASLAAIARTNPVVSAFVDVLGEQAIREAKAIDRRVRSRSKLPPFAGVPIGIKDLNLARGSFTRFGSRAFERFFAPFDDVTTARLRAAGFVILGKTATSELGALPVTEPDIHPPTRNPWDLGVTAGGSSGGAGAAVAAGMIPIAQGSDAGGSIRIPASFCHLFGLKPSRGRVENSYGLEDGAILYTCGPIAQSVEDAAAMLDAMAGVTVGRPHWAPLPPDPFLAIARRPPRRLRVRVVTRSTLTPTDPEVEAAVKTIAARVADLGHEVDEGAMAPGSIEDFLPVWQRLAAECPVHDWSRTQPVTRWLGEAGKHVKREDVARKLAKMSREVLAWFGDVDAWITPTVAIRPPRVGAFRHLEPRAAFEAAARLGVFTAPFNVSGQPAASLPAGIAEDGWPIGVQIAGRPLGDGTVLALCRQIEEAWPWRERRAPPLPAALA